MLLTNYRFTPARYGSVSERYDTSNVNTISLSGSLANQILDLSGNNRHMAATDALRPTYSATAANNKPGLIFGGTQRMSAGIVPVTSVAGLTVHVVGQHAAQNNQMYISKHLSGTDGTFYVARGSVANSVRFITVNTTPTGIVNEPTGITDNVYQLISVRYTGSVMQVFINGVQVGSDVVQTGNLNNSSRNLMMGNFDSLSWPLNGVISEIFVRGASETDAQLAQCVKYFRDKWGI